MNSNRLFALYFAFHSLISIISAYPTVEMPEMPSASELASFRRSNVIKKEDMDSFAEMDDNDYMDEDPSEEYTEKMADIFGLPLTATHNRRRKMLEFCKNVICMPHTLCINDRIVTNGTELLESRISLRMLGDPSQIICDDMEMPCCADDAMANLNQPQNDANRSDDGIVDGKIKTDGDSNETDYGTKQFDLNRCGSYRQQTTTRILNGDDARPNEFSWMIGLFLRLESDSIRFIGGGSLIHRSVILTAAHLVVDIPIEKLIVRAGEHNIMDPILDDKRQERNVTQKIIHSDLYLEAFINDIALLVVNDPFELTDTVNTICIPPQSNRLDDGVLCTSCGWGKNAPNRSGQYQAALKKVTLPINARTKCEHILRQTRLGPFYNLDESLLCAGGGSSGSDDTCKGDGGSPLFCEIPQETGRYYQAGIVAAGIGCGGQTPGLYVNVGHFSNWIKYQLGYINFNFDVDNILSYEQFD